MEGSQSKPVIQFDTKTCQQVKLFGSIREAFRKTGIPISTISRQARYKRPTRKEFYFRFCDDEDVVAPQVIGMFDFDTDLLVDTFLNSSDAAKQTGICARTIAQQVKNDRKPMRKQSSYYFLKLSHR